MAEIDRKVIRGTRLWVERDESGKVFGFAEPDTWVTDKERPPARKTLLGVGDDKFARREARVFFKNAASALRKSQAKANGRIDQSAPRDLATRSARKSHAMMK